MSQPIDDARRTVDAYSDPRCAAVADAFEGPDRDDLDVYAAMVEEFRATSVIDVGCGTGMLATMLASWGIDVVGIDPSSAALDVARAKPCAGAVHWILGTASDLPRAVAEVAFMTANVAQEFLTDDLWAENLGAIHRALRPGGRLAFESRDPERRAWEGWTKQRTYSTAEIEGEGKVESWVQLESVDGEFVRFVGVTIFGSDGERVDEISTLRFRSRSELAESLERAGFTLEEVRDAPDRPGREFVFLARRL